MLDLAVGVEQLGADDADLGARGLVWLEKMWAAAAQASARETVSNQAAAMRPRPDMVVS